MALDKNDPLVVPVFKIHTTKNEAKSREAGRPIFDDMEVVEVRFAGDRNKISVFPGAGHLRRGAGRRRQHAQDHLCRALERAVQALQGKAQQIAEGTPVDELPFLTQAKRAELKALSIYTAEALRRSMASR
jgi:hypothetical protein